MMELDVKKFTNALKMMNKGVKAVLQETEGVSTLDEAVRTYAWLINGINALDQYEISYNSIPLSQIRIPAPLLQFVFPQSVKLVAGKSNYRDLVVRPNPQTALVTLGELEVANNIFAKNLKESKVETKPVTDVRVDRSLLDMLDIVSVNGKCLITAEDAYLIPVEECVALTVGVNEFVKDATEVEDLFFKTFARKNS